jgi:hypothetical protein
MSQSGTRCRVCLLYDAENIGGGASRAREVLKALNAVGLDVVSAATTHHWQTRDLASVLPLDPVAFSGSTPAGKDYEDILLATASGYFLCRALTKNESIQGIVLASEDKLVSMCLLPWLRMQFPTYIVGLRSFVINQTLENLGVNKIVIADYTRKEKVVFDPVFSHDRYSFEFSDENVPRYP